MYFVTLVNYKVVIFISSLGIIKANRYTHMWINHDEYTQTLISIYTYVQPHIN